MLNRRNLIRQSVKLLVAAPVAAAAIQAWAEDKKADKKAAPAAAKKPAAASPAAGDVKMVDPATDAVAKALGYNPDATKAPRTDKMGVKAAEQFCHNCQLYTKEGDKYGKCTMLVSGKVTSDGWCTSWMKKA